MKYCESCKEFYEENLTACPICNSPQEMFFSSNKNKKFNIKVAIGIIIVVISVSLILFLIFKPSEEVRTVMNLIDDIGIVSLDSEDYINSVNTAYNNLSEKDKAKVKNHDALYVANRQLIAHKIEDLNNTILNLVQIAENQSVEGFEAWDFYKVVEYEYNNLSDQDKQQVYYDDYLTAISDVTVMCAARYFCQLDFDLGLNLIQQLDHLLSDDQKLQAMCIYGNWYCYDLSEQALISSLKNPKSYQRVSGKAEYLSTNFSLKNNLTDIEIEYYATNSFGGELLGRAKFVCTFDVDLEKHSIVNVDILPLT